MVPALITVIERISATQVKVELAGQAEVLQLVVSNGMRRCLGCNKLITFGTKSWKATNHAKFRHTKCWCVACFTSILAQ